MSNTQFMYNIVKGDFFFSFFHPWYCLFSIILVIVVIITLWFNEHTPTCFSPIRWHFLSIIIIINQLYSFYLSLRNWSHSIALFIIEVAQHDGAVWPDVKMLANRLTQFDQPHQYIGQVVGQHVGGYVKLNQYASWPTGWHSSTKPTIG